MELAERATAAINGWKTLKLTCASCLRIDEFKAATRGEATDKAVLTGWKSRNYKEICPKCP